MNKGIVMELTDKNIIVMREDGRFDKISRQKRACQIGEEILYADTRLKWTSPSIAGRSATVAAVVFCLVVIASFAGKIGSSEVVAYVSLDINPSIEMGIDEKEQVLELRGLNNDGTELIAALNFKGKSLETVTASLLNKAEEKSLAKGEGDIVIASSVILEKSSVIDTQIAEKLRQQVTEHIKQTHPDQVNAYQVESFAAPQEVREEANKSGVSMGKYSVYLNAKNNGIAVTVDDMKKESIHQIVKDNAKENQDNKTVVAVIEPNKVPSKESIKKLIEEEKSGELDKRLDEKKKEQLAKNNDKNNNDKNNNSSKNDNTKNDNTKNDNTKNDNTKNDNSKNDQKKPSGSSSNNNVANTSSNNSKDKKDDKTDDRSDDKKTVSPTNSGKLSNPASAIQSGTNKPGTVNSGATRQEDSKQTDQKKDDVKKDDSKKDDSKKDDSKKEDDKQKLIDEAKRIADQKKREEDLKKQEDKKKESDKKTTEEDKKKEDSKKADDRSKDSDTKKDADQSKTDDSKKEDSSKR
jgi:hypothetical protein